MKKGFAVLEVALVVAVLVVLGFIGWRYYDAHHQTVVTPDLSSTYVAPAPEIKSVADLDIALNALNRVDIDNANVSDSSHLNDLLSQF